MPQIRRSSSSDSSPLIPEKEVRPLKPEKKTNLEGKVLTYLGENTSNLKGNSTFEKLQNYRMNINIGFKSNSKENELSELVDNIDNLRKIKSTIHQLNSEKSNKLSFITNIFKSSKSKEKDNLLKSELERLEQTLDNRINQLESRLQSQLDKKTTNFTKKKN